MKRTIISLFTALLAVFMVSCTTGPDEPEPPSEPTEETQIHGNWKTVGTYSEWIGSDEESVNMTTKTVNNTNNTYTTNTSDDVIVADSIYYSEPDSSMLSMEKRDNSNYVVKLRFVDSTLTNPVTSPANGEEYNVTDGSYTSTTPLDDDSPLEKSMESNSTRTKFIQGNVVECDSTYNFDQETIVFTYEFPPKTPDTTYQRVYIFDAAGTVDAAKYVIDC